MRFEVPNMDTPMNTPVKQRVRDVDTRMIRRINEHHDMQRSVMGIPRHFRMRKIDGMVNMGIEEMYDLVEDDEIHYILRLVGIIKSSRLDIKLGGNELVEWMCNYNSRYINRDNGDKYGMCIELLCMGQIEECCQILIKEQNYHLALAISSAFNGNAVLQELNSKTYNEIDVNTTLGFLQSLVTGDLWNEPIQLTWSQVFILRYYFYFGPSNSLEDVLAAVFESYTENRYIFKDPRDIVDPNYYLLKWFYSEADEKENYMDRCITLIEDQITGFVATSFIIKRELHLPLVRELRHLLNLLLTNRQFYIATELLVSLNCVDILTTVILIGMEDLRWTGKWSFNYILKLNLKDGETRENLLQYFLNNITDKHADLIKYFNFLKLEFGAISDAFVKQYVEALQEHGLLDRYILEFMNEFDGCIGEDLLEVLQHLSDQHLYYFPKLFIKKMNGYKDTAYKIDDILSIEEWQVEAEVV